MKTCALMRWTLLLSLAIIGGFSVRALAKDPSAEEAARRAKVVARIGAETITVGEIEDIVAARSPYARRRFSEPEMLKELVDAQVQNELFYQGANKLGYAENPRVKRFVDQTAVKVFVRREFEEAVTPDQVPQDQVEKYYEEHSEEFRRPEMRRARHILVASREEASELRKRLQSDETQSFRALAKKKSLDTETNVRGGDLLFFTADGKVVGRDGSDAIDATLVKAAFSLAETGDLSQPLDLGDGKWSILELTGIRPERVQTLEQAASSIRRKLWREEREAALDALIAELRAELKPEVHPERMDAIVLEAAAKPDEPASQ